LYPGNRKKFRKVIQNKTIDYPAEFVYGLVANRWISSLPYRVGLIGASNKLKIIQSLCEYPEYQNYIGRKNFQAFIDVPQKFACDDLAQRLLEIKSQLLRTDCDIYLLGVGHLKSGILHELPSIKKAVYLDVGSGIDALAGVMDPKRPYFGDWINYRLPEPSLYDELDLLNFNGENVKRLTSFRAPPQ
jgi:hypothetical protein